MALADGVKFVYDSIRAKPWTGPVIDLGAGEEADWYKGLFGDSKYITLDLEQNKTKTIDIIADLLNMPQVPSESYGVVLLLDTLEHVKYPMLAFKESARILKPGGIFICTTVASWEYHPHPKDYWRFLPDGLRILCRDAKLTFYLGGVKTIGRERRVVCNIAAFK